MTRSRQNPVKRERCNVCVCVCVCVCVHMCYFVCHAKIDFISDVFVFCLFVVCLLAF